MSVFLHIGFFVSFAYAIFSMLLGAFAGQALPLLSFVCLFGGLLVSRLPDALAKLCRLRGLFFPLGALLAAVGFAFLPQERLFFAAYALLLALAALLSWRLRFEARHERFLSTFRFTCVAAVVLICVILLLCTTKTSSEQLLRAEEALWQVLPVLIVMLSNGILALRGLRAADGAVDRAQLDRRQLIDAVSYFALCAVCFVLQPWKWIIALFDALYRCLLDPMAQGLGSLGDRLFELLRNPNASISGNTQPSGGDSGSAPPAASVPDATVPVTTEPSDEPLPNSAPMTYVYVVFLLLLLAIGLVILIYKLHKIPRRVKSYPNEEREQLGQEEAQEKPISRFVREPRMKIRYYYQTFLRRLRAKKADIRRSDTCAEISERAAAYTSDREALEEFTALYRKARYCDTEAPTAADAARAKSLSKKA